MAQFRDLGNADQRRGRASSPIPTNRLGRAAAGPQSSFPRSCTNPRPRADGNNLEFIELYNSNPWFQDISGYQLVGGNMTYTFPAGTILAGGAFLVVAASPQSIQNVYGITNVVGPYTGTLKNIGHAPVVGRPGGDPADGSLLQCVIPGRWRPMAPATRSSWPIPPTARAIPGPGTSATSSAARPGRMKPSTPARCATWSSTKCWPTRKTPPCRAFVELYNHSNQTNDLSGCILTDDPATNKFVLPPARLIGPRGFVSFNASQLGFVLNGAGGTVYLHQARWQPGAGRACNSRRRPTGFPLGAGPTAATEFYPLAARTPGTNNSPVQIGDIVINELMYDPISGNDDDQYIELYNKGTNTVSLANWQFICRHHPSLSRPARPWRPDSYLVVAPEPDQPVRQVPEPELGQHAWAISAGSSRTKASGSPWRCRRL